MLLPWQGITKLPIIIKGIQCVEDVEIAHEHGAAAVVLSNHGVRVMYFELSSGQLIFVANPGTTASLVKPIA